MKEIKNVLFDVDSTLVTIEGLDYLADLKKLHEVVAPITKLAMEGKISMREAMERKMKALSPSISDLEKMGQAYLENVVPEAREAIEELMALGIKVWILTGNFQPAVGILAAYLGIPSNQVITNEIQFDEKGDYKSIDFDHPLSNNHGKANVILAHGEELNHSVMVGDGSTDLDTKSVVDLFIGFGGVVRREAVAESAEVFIENLREVQTYIKSRFD